MSRFPSQSMKAMLERYPDAPRFIQARMFDRDGAVVEVEAPCTKEAGKAILGLVLGVDLADPSKTGGA